eukprot:CAMPEP_0118865394 /NCGR_PEP_ID=MMETSP1163-20130328/9672_1 /TAXON_ID=124430 /ORGANISM="Phaeomonas parva, Strain CCMP2877" /LENGTH=202 /DNA_ID=CAMNT_0006799619 /DNA_START=219 /DNA_END=824 /DNA_ORIENTATION=+
MLYLEVHFEARPCERYYLKPGEPVSIGRKGSAINIKHDMSISRNHAVITVKLDAHGVPTLEVTDHSSVGTFYANPKANPEAGGGDGAEELQLPKNQSVVLPYGTEMGLGNRKTRLRFASLNWRLCFCKFPAAGAGEEAQADLERAQHEVVNTAVAKLGLSLTLKFDANVTHLLCPPRSRVTANAKMIGAVLKGAPIVTTSWL